MSPGPVRVPVPTAVVGAVIALCAVLLLKWLAVVALAAVAVTVLARWAWRRHRPDADADGDGDGDADPGTTADPARPAPRADVPADCTWCGLAGGHLDLRGRPVRPRHAHAGGAAARR